MASNRRATLLLPLATAAALVRLGLLPGAAAQFNTECGVGEVSLKMKVGGTDRLTKCSDFFDDPDPYTIVTVGSDRLGIQKMTARIDNTDTPTWDALLDFGCVEKDSRISFRVKDWDYFGDETCLGPLSIIEEWPPSAQPALVCEQEAINGVGTGCVSFALFYGPDAAEAASSGLEIPPVPGTSPTATTDPTTSSSNTSFVTPTTPSTAPVVEAPGVPPSTTEPTATGPAPRPARNTTRPPLPPPPPPAQPRKSDGPSPAAPPRSSGNDTAPKRPPSVVGAPAPTMGDGAGAGGEERAKSSRRSKGAAVAGGVITSLALVGAAVGVYASRRRRRQEGHTQNLDLEDPNSGRTMGEAPGSVAVL